MLPWHTNKTLNAHFAIKSIIYYASVASWITANGYKMNGPMFNIYHVGPVQAKDPADYVTEACFPIA